MMKIKKILMALAAVGVMTVSTAQAATTPSKITAFDNVLTSDVFSVTATGWSDPAFGDMGWTHKSGWGSFTAKKGQNVTVTLVATDKGIHPGTTIWYRGANDTAPDSYVVDHFYPQNANFAKMKAVTEDTGEALGNIIMKYVAHGYDLDKNTVNDALLKGKKDTVAGKFTVTFKAPYDGAYMFVVGGFNPDANITGDATAIKANHDVNVKVSIK